jgi:hypothetical protein
VKPPDKLSLEEIAKAADDVRTIQRFQDEALNDGFNGGVISASVTPKRHEKSADWPLILFSIFIAVLLAAIGVKFFAGLDEKASSLLLVGCLLIGTLAVMCAHIRFKQIAVTIIVSVGLVFFLAVGFGVLTPREAIDEAKGLVK